MAEYSFPETDDRTIVVGATGSGKTQFGGYLLSTRDGHIRPWMLLDFKGEKLFRELGLEPWALENGIPENPGLYWCPIIPGESAVVSEFFRTCYLQGNVGIFIDESTMLPGRAPVYDDWVGACLTQGRSKNIEIIACTQRPANIDVRFFSEASFMSIFNIRLPADKKRLSEYTDGLEINRLPRYHSLWYDVVNDRDVIFQPVPPPDELVRIFREQIDEFEAEQETANNEGIIKL